MSDWDTMMIPKGCLINEEQDEIIHKEMVLASETVPVRFLINGQNVCLETGKKLPKGTNIIHQYVYWNFPKELALKVAKWIGAKAIFSEE